MTDAETDDYEVILDFEEIERDTHDIERTQVATGVISDVGTQRNVRYRYVIDHGVNVLEERVYYCLGDDIIGHGPSLTWDYDPVDETVQHGWGFDLERFIRDSLHNDPEGVIEEEFTANTSWEADQ